MTQKMKMKKIKIPFVEKENTPKKKKKTKKISKKKKGNIKNKDLINMKRREKYSNIEEKVIVFPPQIEIK
jgi:hypothetical protein